MRTNEQTTQVVKKGISASIVSLMGAGYAYMTYHCFTVELYGWMLFAALMGIMGVICGYIIHNEIEEYGI